MSDSSGPETLQVFALGGTIDKIYFDALSEYQVGEPQVGTIFKDAGIALPFKVTSICSKDSLEIDDHDREALLQGILKSEHHQILITHGTDTMTNTAQYIHGSQDPVLDNKTIVLVGSMNPACFKNSDAPFNIGFALGALRASSPGVYIAMNGSIFNPQDVKKNRAAGQFQPITKTTESN